MTDPVTDKKPSTEAGPGPDSQNDVETAKRRERCRYLKVKHVTTIFDVNFWRHVHSNVLEDPFRDGDWSFPER